MFGHPHQVGCESKNCEYVYVETHDDTDCELTTTSEVEDSGCCQGFTQRDSLLLTDDHHNFGGSSFKARPKCVGLLAIKSCKRKECKWVHTHHMADCLVETHHALCYVREPMAVTAKCTTYDDAAKYDSAWQETERRPEEPDCYTQRQCHLHMSDDGESRCLREHFEDYAYNRSQLRPTTVTTRQAPCCCMTTSYALQDRYLEI